MEDRVFVIRGFDYDEQNRLEDGEVFRLCGYAADTKLRNAKMVQNVEDSERVRRCDRCPKEFLNDGFLAKHRANAHAPAEVKARAARKRGIERPLADDDET